MIRTERYRKKPVVVEVMRIDGDNAGQVALWCHGNVQCDHSKSGKQFWSVEINTLEGVMRAKDGDYVIRGVNGEFYPCKPDIFERTYQKVGVGNES